MVTYLFFYIILKFCKDKAWKAWISPIPLLISHGQDVHSSWSASCPQPAHILTTAYQQLHNRGTYPPLPHYGYCGHPQKIYIFIG